MADSSFARISGVLLAPEKTFHSIRERPTWMVALMVFLVISAGVYLLMSQRMDMAEIVEQSIEARGQDVSEEQLERMIDFYENYGVVFSLAMVVVGTPLFFLVGTLCVWVVVRLVGAELSFGQGFATFVHAQMPHAVGALLSIPAILSRDEFRFEDVQTGSVLPSNLGMLASEETTPAVLSMLSSIDVFSLWTVVLLVIGFAAVGRLKRGTAGAVVVGCWLVYVLGKAGWTALFG